jgi:hypothetical protein
MISMSLADMRAFVLEHLESDEEELPNSLLDRFIANAASKIEAYSRTWDFRAVEYTFESVVDQREYDLDTFTGLADPTPLQDVVAVQGPSYELRPADHRKMRLTFPSNSDSSGDPIWFTKWGRTLYLWPKPSSASTYLVVGYRQGIDWIETNAAPDFPSDFHELIAWWALNRAYVFLDDPELADFYREEFDRELRIRSRPYLTGLDAQPFQINGGTAGASRVPWANRARYDWE